MSTITPQACVARWSDPKARPLFKGSLIDDDGCCCAQGDVLRMAGWTDAALRSVTQSKADKEVANILGIPRGHAVLLRIVNDRADGCPQDVFANPSNVLGPHANLVLAFFEHIDTLTTDDWSKVAAAGAAAWAAAGDAAWDAAGDAAGAAAGDAAGDAAGAAAGAVAGAAAGDAAGAAAVAAVRECVGWSKLKEPHFLKVFFPDPAAWVASVEAKGVIQ